MFETYADNGKLQVNVETYGYYFVGKGSFNMFDFPEFATPETHAGTQGSTGSGGINYAYDLVVFRSDSGFIYPKNTGQSGNSVGCTGQPGRDDTAWGQGYYTGTNYASNYGAVSYWCFRSMRNLPPSTSMAGGLELYDASGQVTYTTKNKPLMVVGYTPISQLSLNQFGPNIPSPPSGRIYAHTVVGLTSVGHSELLNSSYKSIVPMVAGNLTRGYPDMYSNQQNSSNGGILTVDVTGY